MTKLRRFACVWVLIAAAPCLLAAASDEDFAPDQSRIPTPAPEDAIVLFDGGETVRFVAMNGEEINWPIEDGALVSTRGGGNQNHIVSTVHFRDADVHVEFLLPERGAGNSGVYLHGNYELQIHRPVDRPDGRLTQEDVGALYGFAAPLVAAGREPGEWQVYDIRYRAPRRNAEGEIVEEGVVSAWLNGQQVQKETTFGEPRSVYHPFRYGVTPYLETIHRRQLAESIGPVFLQDHGAAVRYRNVWIRPLDDVAGEYVPE